MAKEDYILFTYKDVVECLLRKKNIRTGLWGLRIGFGLGATNIQLSNDSTVAPAAIVPITEIGIQRFEKPSNLTVDAETLMLSPTKNVGVGKKHSKARKPNRKSNPTR